MVHVCSANFRPHVFSMVIKDCSRHMLRTRFSRKRRISFVSRPNFAASRNRTNQYGGSVWREKRAGHVSASLFFRHVRCMRGTSRAYFNRTGCHLGATVQLGDLRPVGWFHGKRKRMVSNDLLGSFGRVSSTSARRGKTRKMARKAG